MAFTAFSAERLIGIPPEWFTDVMPQITLATELKVTLHIFYRLARQRETPKRLSWDELAEDALLQQGLRAVSAQRTVEEMLDEGLLAAVRRGTLLHLVLPGNGRMMNWYMVHTPANRAWAEHLHATRPVLAPVASGLAQRPSIYMLYEQNVGLITPLLADELRDAESRYPYEWIEAAIRESVQANIRSWRYIRRILERWAAYGRQSAS